MGRLLLLAGVILIPITALILMIKRMAQTMAERYRLPSGQFPSTKGVLMFLLPLPVLIAAIMALGRGQLGPLIGDAIGYSLFLAGALLLRRGLLSEGDYDRRRVAKAPWPLKTLGSGLIALATGITAWLGAGHHPVIGGAFGLAALLGCYLNYGFDPRTTKRFTDRDGIDATEQVIQARDLRRARKFLNVYLDGAHKVTEGYAKTHARVAAPELDDNFRRVLITIEEVFQEQQQKLLETDITDLDVQIEVLTTQLKREGVI